MASPRTNLLSAICSAFTVLRQQTYKVHRGPLNWAEYRFDDIAPKRYVVSVICDQSTFLRSMNQMTLTLEIMTRMPDDVSSLQDSVLDNMFEDCKSTFDSLFVPADETQDPLVWTVVDNTDQVIEVSDAALKIQGIVFSIDIKF